jgi:hypothetical protein
MLDWLTSRWRTKELPGYSALRSVPSRGLPPELREMEENESFTTRRNLVERELRQLRRRPPEDEPLFTELLEAEGRGVVTMTLHGSQCLPVFSSPFRAADYVQTLLSSGPSVRYLSSTPLQLVQMLRDVEKARIDRFALDRCPRCSIFPAYPGSSMKTADDVIMVWCIHKATELARADLYFGYAQESARAGRVEIARDVALETVGHVSLEDPRGHLLLGELAVALRDRKLLREAKAFLRFLHLDRWERKLDRVVQSGSADFEDLQ